MGTIYKFKDKDGLVKWGELSIAYNPNDPDRNGIPVVIDGGYKDAGKLRIIRVEDILEER